MISRLALLLIASSFVLLSSCSKNGETVEATAINPTPVKLSHRLSIEDVVSDPAYARMFHRVAAENPQHISTVLHAIRFYGADHKVYRGTPDECTLLELLTDESLSQKHLGGFGLVQTPYGVRGVTVPRPRAFVENSQQSHDLQILATLASLGVPRSHPIRFRDKTLTVGDLLDDAIATFSLEREEIEWSAFSLILYLPPRRTWTNKFGREFNFDELCEHLLDASLDTTCSGTHLLYGMTALLLVDRQMPILEPKNSRRLGDRLAEVARYLEASQKPEGFWEGYWFLGLDDDTFRDEEIADEVDELERTQRRVSRVLATGHHLEWLMKLPPEMQPGETCFRNAGRWLNECVIAESDEVIRSNYCPYTHAVNAVRLLRPPARL